MLLSVLPMIVSMGIAVREKEKREAGIREERGREIMRKRQNCVKVRISAVIDHIARLILHQAATFSGRKVL